MSKTHVPSIKNLVSYFEALRPRQWVKNMLVAAAPIASGQFFSNILETFLALVSFIFASSLGYLVNDWKDREFDRIHLKKKSRPFASGKFNFKDFLFLIIFCLILTATPLFFLPLQFISAISSYLLITLSYSFVIKQVPVLEMIWLASGFLLRALAGSIVIGQSPTGWFVTSVFFGALFIVSCKRIAERRNSGSLATRKVINVYTDSFLNTVSTMSLSVTITTYCLWVFEVHPNSLYAQFSIVPFSFTIMMYLVSCDNGDGESPERLLFSNRYLISGILFTLFLQLMVFYT
jgi:decaprenyl-phosphate phosphoribosyltransferase